MNEHEYQKRQKAAEQEASGDAPTFPMRINKFLAMEGRGSRREMDALVAEGKVLVNGGVAVLGQKVDEGDKVEIRFRGGPGAGKPKGPKGPRPAKA